MAAGARLHAVASALTFPFFASGSSYNLKVRQQLIQCGGHKAKAQETDLPI